MSLRKFMHKRNKYKEEPNFKQLAILYPEFCKIAKTDIAGKIKINFKDEESLKVLTKTLLKHDFNLDIDIPPHHLVPALPLRLNYVLWVEDLLNHCGIHDLNTVHGMDIGTGAICIYPLLFSTLYKSKMICTDIDPKSVESSIKNIEKNNLQDLIEVILVKKESILKEALEKNNKYTFVMCNPPFFETDKELEPKFKQEPPRNAPTGNTNELEVKGGEKEFVLRLIQESLEHTNNIKIYTTMFGQKSSLAFLRNELKKRGIFNFTWTEFCQGYTKRWGIAWTFEQKSKLDLTTAPVIRTRTEVSKMKKDKSMEIIFPARENFSCLSEVVCALKTWLTELEVEVKEIQLDDDYPCWACQLIGYNDTWSHARRKRRMIMHQEALKKHRGDNTESNDEVDKLQNDESEATEAEIKCIKNTEPLLICTLFVREKGKNNGDDSDDDDEDVINDEIKKQKLLRICMLFESGTGGKLSLETLRQYLVNKLNIREFFHKKNPSKPSKKKRKRKINQAKA